MTKTRNLKFYADPGHGWLEVPREDLDALKIRDQISGCSYAGSGKVYLEEDCDANVYMGAAIAAGIHVKSEYQHTNEDSFIRSLPQFRA